MTDLTQRLFPVAQEQLTSVDAIGRLGVVRRIA